MHCLCQCRFNRFYDSSFISSVHLWLNHENCMVTKFPAKAKDTTCRKLYHMPCFAFITTCTSGYAICLKAFENLKSHFKVWENDYVNQRSMFENLISVIIGQSNISLLRNNLVIFYEFWKISEKILIYRTSTSNNQFVFKVTVTCLKCLRIMFARRKIYE